jgi:glycosyltransferase involved in cell wall biosynthesis
MEMNNLPQTPHGAVVGSGPLLSLFVACYNEEENISETLSNVRDACQQVGIDYEIIVINDASLDGSSQVIRHWIDKNSKVPITLIENPLNCGLAANYLTACKLASGTWFRLICGDNVEPKETLVAIFREVGKAEILLPYHIECPGKPVSRKIISFLYTFLVNVVSGNWIRYYNGLPVVRRQYALQYSENDLGFSFQADLVTQLLSLGLSKLEIPVKTHERLGGAANALTKKNFVGVSKALGRIFIRRLRRLGPTSSRQDLRPGTSSCEESPQACATYEPEDFGTAVPVASGIKKRGEHGPDEGLGLGG